MTQTIQLGDVAVDVILKKVKNVHLSVYPPSGAVRISAPEHMSLETVRVFAISKLEWIKRERRKLQDQARETPREYVDRESHFVWGARRLLKVEEVDGAPSVRLLPKHLLLRVRADGDTGRREALLARWYRDQVRAALQPLLSKWEAKLGVTVAQVFVQKMKTKWGSCNPETGTIRLNSELAKKLPECLEYVLVHELTHLLEPTHNDRFKQLLSKFMPHWREWRAELNRAPLAHEDWEY